MKNPIYKNIIAILLGIAVGMAVNMGLVMLSPSIIPLPEGVDPMDVESLKASLHLFETKHFIMPFLAHALGTLAGAMVAGFVAATHKMKFALAMGFIFLIGGIVNAFMISFPVWYLIVDVTLAYLPFAWLGGILVQKK